MTMEGRMPVSKGRVYYRGRWVPRSHFYDHGEEPIYLGPPRRRGSRRRASLIGLAACCVYWFVIGKLLGY